MTFEARQGEFSGPLGLLLELLGKKELAIKDVNLAKIADEYLAYLEKTDVPSEELADFLVIASQLIYLKTRELLPYLRTNEEEEQIENLEEQLRLYKEFALAAEGISAYFASDTFAYTRPFRKQPLSEKKQRLFYMPGNVSAGSLHESFQVLLKKLQPFFSLQEASIKRIKSVKERIVELQDAIQTRAKMGFKDVIKGAQGRGDVVVSFLALLELMRRQVIVATQSSGNDIMIERV